MSQVQNGEEQVIAYYSKTLSNQREIFVLKGESFWELSELWSTSITVSYTHLDVYKRQVLYLEVVLLQTFEPPCQLSFRIFKSQEPCKRGMVGT